MPVFGVNAVIFWCLKRVIERSRGTWGHKKGDHGVQAWIWSALRASGRRSGRPWSHRTVFWRVIIGPCFASRLTGEQNSLLWICMFSKGLGSPKRRHSNSFLRVRPITHHLAPTTYLLHVKSVQWIRFIPFDAGQRHLVRARSTNASAPYFLFWRRRT